MYTHLVYFYFLGKLTHQQSSGSGDLTVVTDPRDAHQPLTEASVHFISGKTFGLQSTSCLILV